MSLFMIYKVMHRWSDKLHIINNGASGWNSSWHHSMLQGGMPGSHCLACLLTQGEGHSSQDRQSGVSADDKAAVEGDKVKEADAKREEIIDERVAARTPAARARKAEKEGGSGGTSQVWRLVYSLWRG